MIRKIFLSRLVPESALEKLQGFEVTLLPEDEKLACPESSHPDMIMCALDGVIFADADYVGHHLNDVFTGDTVFALEVPDRSAKYPNSVSFNALVTDSFILCNEKTAHPALLAKCAGREVISTPQGYAACSTLWDGTGAVTADRSIYEALTSRGIEALLIREGSISLAPYPYGFIGGASFRIDDTVFTFGSLDTHPDGGEIKKFIASHGKNIVPLLDGTLTDFGGATVI